MNMGPTSSPMEALDAVSGRLATATVAREALERYPWPLWNRGAGYITVCAAVIGTIVGENLSNVPDIIITLGVGLAFLAAFHLLSGGLAQMPRSRRAWLVAMQIVCALALFQLVTLNETGPLLLLFAVACELQFLASQRIALAGAAGLWLLALATFALLPYTNPYWVRMHMGSSSELLLTNGASSLTGFIFVVVFTRSAVTELIQRHQATILLDELNATHAQLQSYVGQVEGLTVARERNRMAREIHDTLGHYLTVINVQIETAQKLNARDPGRGQAALATAKTLASECLAEVRRSVEALRPAALDGVALPEAIARLVDDLRRASGVTIHVQGQGVGTLSPAAEVAVYRVIQEALTNVRKHAEARNVWLSTEWGPVWFTASIHDDGRGASLQQPNGGATTPGFGLHGMRERVEAVGGNLEVSAAPGAGFRVLLRVPCLPGPSTAPAPRHYVPEVAVP